MRKYLTLTALFFSISAFAAREGGGGDPKVDDFLNNFEIVCNYFTQSQKLKNFSEKCLFEFKDLADSVNNNSRKARVFTNLGIVKDDHNVPKMLVTTNSNVEISGPAWDQSNYEQRLIAAFMEAKLILDLPVDRYGSEELKLFKNSKIFINTAKLMAERHNQIYFAKDIGPCQFTYEYQGDIRYPIIRTAEAVFKVTKPGYKCLSNSGHVLEMVYVRAKPDGFHNYMYFPREKLPPGLMPVDIPNTKGAWIVWKDLTIKKYYSAMISFDFNVLEWFYQKRDACKDQETKNYRGIDALPAVKWRSVNSNELFVAIKNGVAGMGQDMFPISTGEMATNPYGNEPVYKIFNGSTPNEFEKAIRIGDFSTTGYWLGTNNAVMCIGEDSQQQ